MMEKELWEKKKSCKQKVERLRLKRFPMCVSSQKYQLMYVLPISVFDYLVLARTGPHLVPNLLMH